jgi:TolA-binding protein
MEGYDPTAADAPERAPYIQKSFRTGIDLLLQARDFDEAALHAESYLNAFPTGAYTAEIRTWYNEAKAQAQ